MAVQAARGPDKPQLSAQELLENAKEQARVRPGSTLPPPSPLRAPSPHPSSREHPLPALPPEGFPFSSGRPKPPDALQDDRHEQSNP